MRSEPLVALMTKNADPNDVGAATGRNNALGSAYVYAAGRGHGSVRVALGTSPGMGEGGTMQEQLSRLTEATAAPAVSR